jgi:hypothetical protein
MVHQNTDEETKGKAGQQEAMQSEGLAARICPVQIALELW